MTAKNKEGQKESVRYSVGMSRNARVEDSRLTIDNLDGATKSVGGLFQHVALCLI